LGIDEIFASRFEPLQNSNKVQSGFVSEFYNSKSIEILEFGQKENLFYMK
jgi:hypothetical protein